jgi:hypothetical protein
MPWTPAQRWLFPAFRLAWAELREPTRGPQDAPVFERCVCNLRIAWVNPSERPARYEARFTASDGRPFDDLRFGGTLAPRSTASFDLLGHPALTEGPAAPDEPPRRADFEREGWFELLAGPGLQVAVWQEWLDERAGGGLCRWSQELGANAGAGSTATPVEPSEGPAPALWRRFDGFLRPAARRVRPGVPGAPGVPEHRQDPRCAVIRRDIELLEREFESLRGELEHTPAARREAVRLLIDAVEAEQRALAAEARSYGCPEIEAALHPAVPPVASAPPRPVPAGAGTR